MTAAVAQAPELETAVPDGDRTYHEADTPYSLPNDEAEWRRLDVQHYGIKEYFGGNNAGAPFRNPKKILEIGAGNGVWAMEVANEYPEAEVLAVDISEIKSAHKPSNCIFQVLNIVKEWPFEPNTFDIIHCRFVTVHIPDFKKVMNNAISALAAGGVILFEDIDADFVSDLVPVPPAIPAFFDIYRAAFGLANVDTKPGQQFEGVLKDSGVMSEIHVHRMPAPMGAWTDDRKLNAVGLAMRTGLVGAGRSQHQKLYNLGMTQKIVDDWTDTVMTESNKLYMDIWFTWARKKLE